MAVHVVTSTNTVVPVIATVCSPWWLFDGITDSDCLAAYTALGAVDRPASYDNNAAPGNGSPDGSNDLSTLAAPSWDVGIGWSFNGSTQYLDMGGLTIPATDYSLFVRYSGALDLDNQVMVGYYGASYNWYINPRDGSLKLIIDNFRQSSTSLSSSSSGVVGFSNRKCWRNGILVETLNAGTLEEDTPNIGRDGNNSNKYWYGNIQALAIYRVAITDVQATALTVAMNAIPDYA